MPRAPRLPARASAALSVAVAGILALVAGCERQSSPPQDRSAAADTTATAAPAPAGPTHAWDSTAGVLFIVRDDSVARAVYPAIANLEGATLDEATVRDVVVESYGPHGSAGALRVTGFAAEDSLCVAWPAVTTVRVDGSGPAISDQPRWTVAFIRGTATPIPLQPIEALARSDSARLAAELARLASGLPDDTAQAFRGLPFAVRAAYRFSPAAGIQAVVAEIVRRLPVEANPLEESLLLIGERSGGESYRVAYSRRTAGEETRAEQSGVLAAVHLGASRRPALVLERIGYESVRYMILDRIGSGRWRVLWQSPASGC